MKSYRYKVEGLDCANCAKKIEDKISKIEGYEDVKLNFSTQKLSFKTDNENVEKDIKSIIKKIEPDVKIFDLDNNDMHHHNESHSTIDVFRIIIGLLIFAIAYFGDLTEKVSNVLVIISFIILLYKTGKVAIKQLFKGNAVDENTLIVISAIGAYLIGKTTEGLMVITLYEIGKILEARAINKTRKSISELMNIKPEYANLKVGSEIKKVKPEEVKIGEIIVVKTGEKIPLDGIVIKGNAELDNSSLTGESKLQNVEKNSKVLSGSINVNGLLEIKVESTYENSTVSQILNLVENATDNKAKTETLVSRLAKVYTPTVMILSAIVGIFLPIIFKNVTYSESIYKALVFLVISCPCSIAISVPLSYFSGIGKASKEGILVKGSDYLDGIKDIKTIVFDKTGTLTTGEFTVSKVNSYDKKYKKDDILKYIAMGEKFSTHPIAKAVLKKYTKSAETSKIIDYEEKSGKGIQYTIDNDVFKIGNAKFTEYKEDNDEVGTVLYLSVNNKVVGSIVLLDEAKKDTKEAIKKLQQLGINTIMFTGDEKKISEKIAKDVGIKNVNAEMLPQDKYKELEKIIKNNKIGKVAFVGDGINDSPVLARSDIGISMGGIGSSSAVEASDVVIMTDEIRKIIDAINISKKTTRIIKQNLIFAIGVKILVLVLSLLGIANMWEAVFADVGTTLITILNTIRILK